MLLKNLYIKEYKKWKDTNINFSEGQMDTYKKEIFKGLNISTLVGNNGTGKTTIMSFIAIIFRYLQRKQIEIPSDFNLEYSIDNNIVQISKKNKSIFFKLNNQPNRLLLEYDIKKGYIRKEFQNDLELRDITYDEIKAYLPSRVIVSYFDIDYPGGYHWKYKGHKLLVVSSGYYTDSTMGLDLSKGILEFLSKFYTEDRYFLKLILSLGLNFSDTVRAYYAYDYIDENEFQVEISKFFKQNDTEITSNLIKKLIDGTYFKGYFHESSNSSFDNYFKLKKFLQTSKTNKLILKYLIEKKLFYINDFFIKKDEIEYPMEKMSTGEKMILGRLFFILSNISDNALVIIEEPEVHLNYSWVKYLISLIIILFKEYKSQFLISSHNYAFINNLFPEQVLIMNEKKICHPNFNTLLCIDEEINHKIFNQGNVKNYMEEYIYKLLKENKVKELKECFNSLGESYMKIIVFKKLIELGEINVENH